MRTTDDPKPYGPCDICGEPAFALYFNDVKACANHTEKQITEAGARKKMLQSGPIRIDPQTASIKDMLAWIGKTVYKPDTKQEYRDGPECPHCHEHAAGNDVYVGILEEAKIISVHVYMDYDYNNGNPIQEPKVSFEFDQHGGGRARLHTEYFYADKVEAQKQADADAHQQNEDDRHYEVFDAKGELVEHTNGRSLKNIEPDQTAREVRRRDCRQCKIELAKMQQ
jgi:hypothetical protein